MSAKNSINQPNRGAALPPSPEGRGFRAVNMMKIAAVLPARYASTRFPGKPLTLIKGMSLLQRTYQQVLQCPVIDLVVVATDDARISDHVRSFGGAVCMTPSECATGTDRVGYAARHTPELKEVDIIINVQGDEPCIDPMTIEKVARLLTSDRNIDIGTASCPITSNEELLSPHVVKCVLTINNRALYFSRAALPSNKQLSPSVINDIGLYMRHIGIYGFRRSTLERFISLSATPLQLEEDIEALRALEHGMSIAVCRVQGHAPSVDTPEDIRIVEKWLEQYS